MFSEEYDSSDVRDVLPQQSPAEPPNHDAKISADAETGGFLPAEERPDTSQEGDPGSVERETLLDLAATARESPEAGEIDSLFASMDEVTPITPGEVVRCRVLKVTDEEVIIDVGIKSEAAIPIREFIGSSGTPVVAAGDLIEVLIESYDEEEDSVVASHQKAAHLKVWDNIENAYRDQTCLKGRVLGRTKGGLEVDIGVRAFLPASQADLRPLRDPDSLIGEEITCKVAKLDRKRNNVVVSRRAALEEELNRRRSQLTEQLVEGAVLTGHVKNLVDYGAFVDLGGIDGLLHITDLSWGRVAHPSEVVRVGQELQVKVLKYVPEKDRVSLGLKQLSPDPWERVSETYHPGDRVSGRVVSLTDYGAFVELEPGIEGLIHVSEISWSKRPKHPSKVLNAGDRAEVAILDVNAAQRRISLSLKQTLPDPWSTLGQRCGVGATIEGRVRNLTDFGAFVEVEEGVDGLIHLSDLSWTKKVKHPSEVLKKGQTVQAVVLALDPQNRRLSLGLKQLQPDIWEQFFSETHVGDVLKGKVVRMAPFGAFVELREGVEGLCHVSEMHDQYSSDSRGLTAGRDYLFRVLRLAPGEKRIGLSINGVDQGADGEENAQVKEDQGSSAEAPKEAARDGSAQPVTQTAMAAAFASAKPFPASPSTSEPEDS
jgi:small subunit ribosomal protein S1